MEKILVRYPLKFFIILFLIITIINGCSNDSGENSLSLSEKEKIISLNHYGIDTSKFFESVDVIKKNQTFSTILLPLGISYNTIYNLVQASKDIFDIKKILSGKNYYIYFSKDSLYSPSYFVYEKDPVNYVIFNLQKPKEVKKGKRKVRTEIKESVGIIYQSLFEALEKMNIDPELGIKLEEIYGWTIDFYTIQPGDYFKVIYEEAFIGDESIGIKKINASCFNHMGNDYYAILFNSGKTETENRDYFDEKGNSLRKAFLKAPLKYRRISSRFSLRRFHPILKRYRPHYGTDYAADYGTPIHSVGDGTVTRVAYTRGAGRFVEIKHNSIYKTRYLHMSRFAKGLSVGDKVKQDQIIGYVGSSGLATAAHLHFEIWKYGRQVDWRKIELPPSKPVETKLMDEFNLVKKEAIQKLERTTNQELATLLYLKTKPEKASFSSIGGN